MLSMACLAAVLLAAGPGGDGVPSRLWGRGGEAWKAEGRLPDFSWAGYRMGGVPLPDVPVRASVRDFGARGDGETDDTRAFQEALERAPEGAILVPAGRYRITGLLMIRRSRVVLRGEGPDRSVLVCPTPLNEILPNWGATTTGRKTSNYSWGGGFVVLRGGSQGRRLGTVAERASRGAVRVRLADPVSLKPGDVVEIRQSDAGGTLADHLYAGQAGDIAKLGTLRTRFVSPVAAVDGAALTLSRPLRTDVDPLWAPEVWTFEPEVTESGVEKLGFEFPSAPYEGHFTELGWNPLAFQGVAHCWARDLRVVNGDSGVFLSGTFCTVRGIALESARPPDRAGLDGHHGISASGDDNLVEDFEIRRRYVHDLTVTRGAGNVFRRGRGADLAFDHHKKAPHANLFTDLDVGEGSRVWRSGGGAALGLHSGAWETFWNLRSRKDLVPPPRGFGPDRMNFVGLRTSAGAVEEPDGRWWEAIAPERLSPADLYAAQLARRLGRNGGPR